MKIDCFCNGDNIKDIQWIDNIGSKPEIGEFIQSKCRRHTRKIVRITHCLDKAGEYYLNIELQPISGDIRK